MIVKVVVFSLILGLAMGMPDQGTKTVHDSLEPNDDDAGDWVAVGELVYDVNVTTADGTEEALQDANDPMILSDDLCHSLMNAYSDMPEHFSSTVADMKLDQPSLLGYARCFRTRYGINYICRGPLYINYQGYRYCCGNPRRLPILTRRGNFIRCRCPF
ncbi:uncharacterized protein [Macrobrachium rosenbergii]|uniref:uncharacterized protein n=1 Tax=Macrobrachium rosenbergii TaxID=79674 RepID=UPI0034D72601